MTVQQRSLVARWNFVDIPVVAVRKITPPGVESSLITLNKRDDECEVDVEREMR
jgi:hypothetical protein